METEDEFRAHLRAAPEIILADFSLPAFDAVEALRILRESRLDIPFVVVTGTVGEDAAVAMMRAGAGDYLLKGQLTRLPAVIERELREAGDRRRRRRSEERQVRDASLLSQVRDALVVTDPDGVVTYWNEGAGRLFGWTAAEMVGRPLADRVPEAGRGRMAEATRATLAGGEFAGEWEDWRKDGSRVWVDARVGPITDPGGRVVGVLVASHDITARKRAELAMSSSEERYRTLIAATTAIVWDSPASGQFNTPQPGWSRFTGQTLEQHSGWGWLTAIHPDDRERSGAAWAEAVRDRTPYRLEHRLRRADGEYRQMSVRAVPILEPDGSVREWVGVHTDLTDQKRVSADLRKAEERLHQVVASSPAVLFTLAVDAGHVRGISWISENVLEVTGYPPGDAVHPNWWHGKVHPEDLGQVVAQTDADLFRVGRATHEYRFRHQDGTYRWTRGDLRLTRDAAGRPVEVVGSWSDITERKSLEGQFHQSQKMDAFGQLAGGVAHDFNNLLTVINGYCELLLQTLPPGDPSLELVEEIHKAGERSAGLTRQLLAFSRQQVLAPKVLDLNGVVTDVGSMLRRVIGEDVRLSVAAGAGLGAVKADPGQVEQVLMNLAVNARDAMPTGGKLTIETRNVELDEGYVQAHVGARPGPHVLLTVSDTGCGMTPAVRAKVFEPFFTTKGAGKGTGLGLATVYGIVKQSGGHVDVYSEVGVGTAFKIYLPRTEPAAGGSKTHPVLRPPPGGGETVLVVEDEDGVRALTRRILAGCGYAVLAAADGTEAVRLAAAHAGPIHLLVTDVVMPGAGGRAVAEAVAGLHPGVRVLYVSGYTDDSVVRHGVLHAGVNFLQKPFSASALAFKVREVLDAPAGGGSDRPPVGVGEPARG